MIRMEDVSYSYGKKEVLHHFNLHVKEGEFLTVIGCSGCGKTTMLKLINALLLPSLGTVYVQGHDIFADTLFRLMEAFHRRREHLCGADL